MDDIASLIATDQIQVEITIRLGGTQLSVAELARLRPDDILTLDQDMSDGVDICVGDRVIAKGELTSGAMIAGSILMGRALAPIETAVSQWAVVQRSLR